MQESKKVKGKVTISRVTDSRRDDDFINISVKDKESGKALVEIQMELAEFANAVTGNGYQKAIVNVLTENIPLAGLKKEVKSVSLPYYSTNNEKFRESQEKEAKPYEIDGWKLVPENYNHHRAIYGFYNATFERYLEVKE